MIGNVCYFFDWTSDRTLILYTRDKREREQGMRDRKYDNDDG
jgi:hypothetical protein